MALQLCRALRAGASLAHVLNLEQFSKQAVPFANVAAHSHDATMRQLLDAARVVSGVRMLDVACGPGIVSLAAAERGADVHGVDLTPACVAAAIAARDKRGIQARRAAFSVAPAEQLPFGDASFDVVLSRYAFHHLAFDARAGVAREMARVARRGATVVICDVSIAGAEQAAAYDALERLRDPSHVGVVAGGAAGGEELLEGAGLRVERPSAGYAFAAAVEDVLGASFPNRAADRDEFMRRMRDPRLDFGISRDLEAGARTGRTPYAVPIGIWVGVKV